MRLRGHLRLQTQWWLIAIVTSLLVTVMTVDRTMIRFDNVIYDHVLQLSPSPLSNSILLVEIDDDSIRRLGRWPWSRATHAALIDRLNAGRPQAIAYDVLFTEPTNTQDDEALGRAIAAGRSVFLPMLPAASEQAEAVRPIDIVGYSAAGVGYAAIQPDPDGVVRSAVGKATGKGQSQHLMSLVARSASGAPDLPSAADLIPFGGGAGRWPEVSAASLLAGEVPPELLRDKLVLVGVTASGLGSRYATPTGDVMSGLEIEGYLLEGLRSNAMIARAGLPVSLVLALVPLWALMILLGPFRRLPAMASFGLCLGAALGFSVFALMALRLWLPPMATLAGLALAYPVWGWRQLAVIERFMRTQLERLEEEPFMVPQVEERRKDRGVAYTIALLRSAITRNREMRHFVADRLDQLPDATLVANLTGRIVLSNVAASKLFATLRHGPEELMSAASILGHFRLVGSGGAVPFPPAEANPITCEVQLDQARFFLVGMAGQTSSDGQCVGWVIRFVDISEAKAIQRQRDDVVQLLTHDMRSPQASILAVLETAPPDRISPRESGIIRQYAERTLQLADGFVQLARAENLEYALEDVDLGDMLMDAIDDLWPQLKAKSIDIVTHGNERLVVTVERSLLTRALVNVIGNAIKYSAEGTTITCALASDSHSDGSIWASCAITDQGQGIAPELRLAIFERFRRGPVGLGPRTSGAGLGLSFVHTVMVRHRGQIECESEADRGTTFRLRLPIAG